MVMPVVVMTAALPRARGGGLSLTRRVQVAVLRKYRRHFGVPSPAVAAKDVLVPTLFRHFDTIEVEEEQVLGKFLNTLRERHAGVEPPPKGKGGKVARGKARGRTKK